MSGRSTRRAARLAGLAALALLAAGSPAASAGPGDGYRAKASRLRVEAQLLDTRTHRALLSLYSLDTNLAAAGSRLASLESRSAALRARGDALAWQLAGAQRTLALSRHELADRLRSLYEQGTPDPVAVVLGAASIDDALTKLDDLTQMADQSRQIVAEADAARTRLDRVAAALAGERRRLAVALAAARQSEHVLASARADRLGYVADLRTRQRLKETQIRSLLATAQKVEAKSQQIQAKTAPAPDGGAAPAGAPAPEPAQAPAPAAAPAPAPAPAPLTAGTRTLTVSATGYSLPGHTATGLPVGWGVVAVDPSVIPLGTRLTVPGYGEAVAADVGSAVRGDMIDLWFPTLAQARAWGRRTVTITLH